MFENSRLYRNLQKFSKDLYLSQIFREISILLRIIKYLQFINIWKKVDFISIFEKFRKISIFVFFFKKSRSKSISSKNLD